MLSVKKVTCILIISCLFVMSSNANVYAQTANQEKSFKVTKSVPDWFKDFRMTYLLMQKRMQKPEYQEYINTLQTDRKFQKDLAKNMEEVGVEKSDSSFDKQNDKKLEIISRQYLSIY